jgi:LysR family transcriptional regulator, nitrogen assimilation regulatory protein
MNTRALAQFLKVVELGSFSKAAVVLGIGQPALSRSIRELETDVGAVLFYRDGRGVRVTPEGRRFGMWARALEDQIAQLRNDLGRSENGQVRRAIIGVLPSVARFFAVPIAQSLRKVYPQAELRIVEGVTAHLVEWLGDGRIDFALLFDTPIVRRFNPEPLLKHPMHLVGAPGPEPMPPQVPFQFLRDRPLILTSRQLGNRRELESIAQSQGVPLHVIIESDSMTALVQLVTTGVASTILPAFAVSEEIASGRLEASLLVDPTIDRTLVLAMQTGIAPIAGTAEFSQEMKARLRTVRVPGS